jgi:DNA processing protein
VPQSEFQQAIERWQPRLKSATALLAVRQAARYGARLLVPDADGWPLGMDDLGLHAPIALWMRGTDRALAALDSSIAIVGARAATGYGEHVTMEVSAGLVDRGYAIVSGAAYGIDGMAHRAALASHGVTLAFLAGGVDRFYPSGHDALLTRIVEEGAVISELPCGQPPTKWRFLQRNRLIAAASQATVVVEAGWRSGSLNTAGHAAEIGRPIGAVPGPVTSATSAGCHRLIRDYGAILVTTADEIAELLGDQPKPTGVPQLGSAAVPERAPSADETRLLDALSFSAPRQTQDIAARAGLSVAAVQSLLGALELEKRVVERERGWVKKKLEDPGKPPTSLV